jgi:hypothetical protein
MKLRKLWGMVGVALAISVLVATLFGTGIMAAGDPGKGNSLSLTVSTRQEGTCAETNTYYPGDLVIWQIYVQDADGNYLGGDTAPLPSVFVNIHGVQLPGGHLVAVPDPFSPPDAPWWVATWTVPSDYAITGTLAYGVVATDKQGNVGMFSDFTSTLIEQP